jgi:hypothetical protein
LPDLHRDRGRAESFGSSAEQYGRGRKLHAAIDAHGGTVSMHGSTLVSRSRAMPR